MKAEPHQDIKTEMKGTNKQANNNSNRRNKKKLNKIENVRKQKAH